MSKCSQCGTELEESPKVCPQCNKPTRIGFPGVMSAGTLGCLIAGALCVGVVAVILLPVFASARLAARRTLVLSQCKDIGNGMALYMSDNGDRYPPMNSSETVLNLIDKYMKGPNDLNTRECATNGTWNPLLSGVLATSINDANEVWLFYSERNSDPGFSGMVFVDNHARFANQFVFDRAMAKKLKLVDPNLAQPTVSK